MTRFEIPGRRRAPAPILWTAAAAAGLAPLVACGSAAVPPAAPALSTSVPAAGSDTGATTGAGETGVTGPASGSSSSGSSVSGSSVLGASGGADGAGLTGAVLEAHLALRYEAYWEAFDTARGTPTANPSVDFPVLAELAAGDQLEVSYQSIKDLAAAGETVAEPSSPAIGGVTAAEEHRIRVDRVDGTVAELSGCVVNDDVRRVVGSGAVIADTVKTVQSSATLAMTDGQWKIIRSQAVQIADGVTGCWLETETAFPY